MSPERQAIFTAIKNGNCTIETIAVATARPNQTVSKLIYKLKKLGLVSVDNDSYISMVDNNVDMSTQISTPVDDNVNMSKLLPHEILLRAANGEAFIQRRAETDSEWVDELYYPTVAEQLNAAKAAAPYYAPRLAVKVVTQETDTLVGLTEILQQLASKLPA